MTTHTIADLGLSTHALPSGYREFLEEIKARIREAQVRASLSVNKELVLLYWSIGKSILDKQAIEGWGAKIIERMARDLTSDFPGIWVFSEKSKIYEKVCRGLP